MKIDSFIESLSTQTKSKETLRAYRQDLTRFGAFLKEKGLRTNQVKQSTIAEFIRHLEDTKGRTVSDRLAPATIARHLTVISAYYEWLRGDSDVAIRNPVERFKRPKVRNEKPRDVDDGILAKLVDGITDLRDRAIVLLFVYSGLRLSELGQLDKTTITLTKRKQPDGSLQYLGSGQVIGKGRRLHRTATDGGRPASSVPVLQEDPPEYQGNSADPGQMVHSPETVAHSRPPAPPQLRHPERELGDVRGGSPGAPGTRQPEYNPALLPYEAGTPLARILQHDGICPSVFPRLRVGFGTAMPG